jgi:hypothetical protein
MATISITLGPITRAKTISDANATRVQNYAVARFSAVQPGLTAAQAVNLLADAIIDNLRAEVMDYERQQAVAAVSVTDLPVT